MALIDFESVKGKTRLNYIYSIGAAVVIMGALFKILHLPGGSWIIGIGLFTEALIFVISAFEPQHLDLDWESVYPELSPEFSGDAKSAKSNQKSAGDDVEKLFSEKLDKIFKEAKLDVQKVEQFGKSLESFTHATSGLSKIGDANKNAQSYSDQLAIASGHVSSLNAQYENQVAQTKQQKDVAKAFSEAAKSSVGYGEELSKAAVQVKEINKMYASQMKNMQDQVTVSGDMVKNLSTSVDDAKKMHTQVKELTNNLSSLNSVYGGMLSAMNVGRK